MARLILSDIITDIRGTVGTHTYSYWKGVHIVKNRSVNYRTAYESGSRQLYHNFIARLSQYWYGGLDQAQRDGWESYADYIATLGFPYYGDNVIKLVGLRQYGGIMSGVNAFVLTNMLRRSIGKTDILEDDPEAITPPSKPFLSELEFELGPPKKIKASIVPPGSFPEDAWLRLFCRGARSAHLIIAKVSGAPAPIGETWDVDYEADDLPPAAAPAWTLIGNEYGAIADSILTCTIPISGASHGYYRNPAWAANWTAEICLRHISGTDRYKFRVDKSVGGVDGYFAIIYIYPTYISVWWGSALSQNYTMDTTDKFHEYRLVATGTTLRIYVDKVLIDTKVMPIWGVSALQKLTFSTVATAAELIVSVDWVKYNEDTAQHPTPTVYEWEVMRYAKGSELPLVNDLYQVQADYISENGRYSPPSAILSQMVRSGFPGGLWGSEYWNNYVWG